MSHRDYVMMAFDLFFDKELLKGKTILDVGCRATDLKQTMEERGLAWQGIDTHPKSSEVMRGDMCNLPFFDNSYDIVFCCHALEHNETPIKALREMKRVMKPDGWLFIATPSPCEHQTLMADADHIMVMTPMQMQRWFLYTEILIEKIYLQKEDIKREQDYNVISIGRKLKI